MHACFVFWNLVGFITLRFSFLKAGALLCSFLLGIAASTGTSNFLLAALMVSLCSPSSGSMKSMLSSFEQCRGRLGFLFVNFLASLSSERLFQFWSIAGYKLMHKFIPMPQAMKIPDAKTAVDKEWKEARNDSSMAVGSSREQKGGFSGSTKRQKKYTLPQ